MSPKTCDTMEEASAVYQKARVVRDEGWLENYASLEDWWFLGAYNHGNCFEYCTS